jgi:hypothetical protein
MLDVCYCGRTFSYPGALKTHQRSCRKNKKRVVGALAAAKEVWINRKRRRDARLAGYDDDQSDSQRVMADAGPAEPFTEADINRDMDFPNMLEASSLSNDLCRFCIDKRLPFLGPPNGSRCSRR